MKLILSALAVLLSLSSCAFMETQETLESLGVADTPTGLRIFTNRPEIRSHDEAGKSPQPNCAPGDLSSPICTMDTESFCRVGLDIRKCIAIRGRGGMPLEEAFDIDDYIYFTETPGKYDFRRWPKISKYEVLKLHVITDEDFEISRILKDPQLTAKTRVHKNDLAVMTKREFCTISKECAGKMEKENGDIETCPTTACSNLYSYDTDVLRKNEKGEWIVVFSFGYSVRKNDKSTPPHTF